MSENERSLAWELMQRGYALPDGPTRASLLEEAVRRAEASGDLDLAFEARRRFIEAATFAGLPEKALVALSWCLAQSDRDPRRFPEAWLLWEYRWVCVGFKRLPQISRRQILDTLDDMQRRYVRCGWSLRPVYARRCHTHMMLGDLDLGRHFLPLWQETPPDKEADCRACEIDFQLECLACLDEDERVIAGAVPILRGDLGCNWIPHKTLARILLPLVRRGRVAEAMRHHRQGYRLIPHNRYFVAQAAEHLVFLVLTDNLAPALKLFEHHLAWTLGTLELDGAFRIYLAVRFLLERLRASGKESVGVRLPEGFDACRTNGAYGVAALEEWFTRAAEGLARRFDARNGNDTYARQLARNRRLKELVVPFPV